MIGLIAKLKVREGRGPEFEAAFRPLAAAVNSDAEPGNLLYKLCKSRTDAGVYVVMELYQDQAAIDAHPKTPHWDQFWPAVAPLLEPGPPQFEFVDTVD